MNIYKKIQAVMKEAVYVQKKGYNSHFKYAYATEADYLRVVRPSLITHGLVINGTEVGNKKDGDITTVTMKFVITDVDDPKQQVEVVMSGTGQDKGDKGLYKAITGAKKYFLATTFFIETGDDAEESGVSNETPTPTVALVPPASSIPDVAVGRPASFRKVGTTGAVPGGLLSSAQRVEAAFKQDDGDGLDLS